MYGYTSCQHGTIRYFLSLRTKSPIMKLSQTAEYALRAVVWLAANGKAATTAQISSATQVPPGYLSKVMRALGKHDIVVPRRGPGGGFTLARTPDSMSLLDIINAVDPLQNMDACPLGIKSHSLDLCPLHARLRKTMATVEATLRDTLISELIADDATRPGLCAEKPAG